MSRPLETLKKYWKYDTFRPLQEDIIQSALDRKSSLVLLPTGGGKSICYQIPSLILEGTCIVISPLIALIEDQVSQLEKKGIKALALTSKLSKDETITAFDNLKYGSYKFLYLSPEKFDQPLIQDKIRELDVCLIAIDEAHCISEWGHDFRPSYLKLKTLLEIHPETPCMALTATATETVLEDISTQLGLQKPKLFKKSFNRTNLSYSVIRTENIEQKLLQIVNKLNEPSIIYTNSRKETKDIAEYLSAHDKSCSFYHGGMSVDAKSEAYEKWISEETPIMVATNAFGMGIDKPNVRAVIHTQIPSSLENYMQEAGRAGRDEKDAYALLLFNDSTIHNTQEKFDKNTPDFDFVTVVYNKLNQYFKIALGEQPENPLKFQLQEFCFTYNLKILPTFNALQILEREDIIYLDDNFKKRSTVKFEISNKVLLNYLQKEHDDNELIKLLLRNYGGIFDHETVIDEFKLSQKLKTSKQNVIEMLEHLDTRDYITYDYHNNAARIQFLKIREDKYTLSAISKNVRSQNLHKKKKLHEVVDFVGQDSNCRRNILLKYFGEVSKEDCGICDVCRKKQQKKIPNSEISAQILKLLSYKDWSSQELVASLNFSDESILKSLQILLDKNKIELTLQNTYKIKNS